MVLWFGAFCDEILDFLGFLPFYGGVWGMTSCDCAFIPYLFNNLPKGPPHLALNPPYFFVFVFLLLFFFLCFPFFVFFYRQKTCFPPKKGIFLFIFSVSLCFSLAFFGPPPFLPFLFLCLSLVLFFLPSFLPVFHFLFLVLAFSFCCVCLFVSRCSFVFVFLLVVLCCFES